MRNAAPEQCAVIKAQRIFKEERAVRTLPEAFAQNRMQRFVLLDGRELDARIERKIGCQPIKDLQEGEDNK